MAFLRAPPHSFACVWSWILISFWFLFISLRIFSRLMGPIIYSTNQLWRIFRNWIYSLSFFLHVYPFSPSSHNPSSLLDIKKLEWFNFSNKICRTFWPKMPTRTKRKTSDHIHKRYSTLYTGFLDSCKHDQIKKILVLNHHVTTQRVHFGFLCTYLCLPTSIIFKDVKHLRWWPCWWEIQGKIIGFLKCLWLQNVTTK